MIINPFKLERYFAKHEFTAKYLLSSSDCDGFPMKYILDCATEEEHRLWYNLELGYTDSQGNELLRKIISNEYSTININEIAVLSPGEANFILMNTLLEAGDEVICLKPSYQSLFQVANDLKCYIKFWEPNNYDWNYNIDDLEKLISNKTKLIIVNFPHNPTGFIPCKNDLFKIVDIARKYNIYLFSDEMYRLLIHNPSDEIPAICDIYEKGISLWGMAKTFGLAGLRIGWLATKDKSVIEKILTFKDYLTICNSATSEILSIIALQHKEMFINPNLQKIRNNIRIFEDYCKQQDFFEFYNPKAGSTAFVKIKSKESALNFCDKLVESTGIMLVPSEMFDYGEKHVRIGFGRENFAEVLNVFDKNIYKYR